MVDEETDAPKRLWAGFKRSSTASAAPAASSLDSVDEHVAHVEHMRAVDALRRRGVQKVTIEGVSAQVEADRLELARRVVMRDGAAGVDYFPSLACHICGGVPFVDPQSQRIKEFHEMKKHDVAETSSVRRANSTPQSMSQLSLLAQHQRARAATGEHDDDD